MIKWELFRRDSTNLKDKRQVLKKKVYKYFPCHSSDMCKAFFGLICQWRNVDPFACPCIPLHSLGKIWCQDRSCYCDNCRYSLTAEGGYSWKSVGLFMEKREGWGSVQGMLHQDEESYKDEAVLFQKSAVSTRYFLFPTLLEATGQEWIWVNSGYAQGEGTRRIQRKMPQTLWRQFSRGCWSRKLK